MVEVGMTYKHFKGGVYKVLAVRKMQHHFVGVPSWQGLPVVEYIRVMWPDGGWDNSAEVFLRPVEDWEAQVEWPTAGRVMKRFVPIIEALDAEAQYKVGGPTWEAPK